MKHLMPLPHLVTETQHLCSPTACYPVTVRWHHQSTAELWGWEVNLKKELAGGENCRSWQEERSWDTAAANTKLDSTQMLPKEFYHKLFTKMWLELETSSLYITDPSKKNWAKMSALLETVVKCWGYACLKKRERRKKISSITFEIFGADLLQ